MRSEKIKICIVMPGHWSASMGGAQYQAACLVDALVDSGQFDTYYVARNVDPSFKPQGYNIINIPRPFGRLKRGYLFLDTIPLLKALRVLKPDIIYTRIGCAYTGISALYAKRNHCKLVWHISSDSDTLPFHATFSKDIVLRYVDRKIFEFGASHATEIIAQTKTQAEQINKTFGREVTAVIENFHPYPKEVVSKRSPVKVVWIANLKPLKQPEIFIQLAKDFHYNPEVEFIMIGSLQGSSRWKNRINRELQSAGNLRYLGFIKQEKVNAVLAESHILVNTSKWEGFTNTFIQAWMRKVPVVSLNVNPDNIFDNHKLGFYAGTYEQLKKYTDCLIRDDTLRHQIGEYAYDYALQHHSKKNSQRILSVLTAGLALNETSDLEGAR